MLRIHVVNSIKGGCGKSTICFYLADYLNQQGLSPLIIDIDLCGTSWYKNYEGYLGENFSEENYHFVNELIDNFDEAIKGHYIANIKTNTKDGDDPQSGKDIKICMANPERNTHIEEVELDLFENAIYKLIMNWYAEKGKAINKDEVSTSKGDKDKEKDIDIILDMPPGYEAHAERIVNHLLLDVNSPLYRKIKKDDIKYKILLYMVTGLSESAINLNIGYIKKLFLNQNISKDMSSYLKKENIFFILNDSTAKISGLVAKDSEEEKTVYKNILDNIGSHIIDNGLKTVFRNDNKANDEAKTEAKTEANDEEKLVYKGIITTTLLKHICITSDTSISSILSGKLNSAEINISDSERSEVTTLFSSFKLGINVENKPENKD